jgi:hypothetical protein
MSSLNVSRTRQPNCARRRHERHDPRAHRDPGVRSAAANTLAGFAEVRLPSGMILHDVGIHIAGASAWASLPGKPMLDRNGVVLRDDRGKIKYSRVITFANKELRDRFSEAIIEAIRLAYPDVLVPTEGRSS